VRSPGLVPQADLEPPAIGPMAFGWSTSSRVFCRNVTIQPGQRFTLIRRPRNPVVTDKSYQLLDVGIRLVPDAVLPLGSHEQRPLELKRDDYGKDHA
jgi:hypothetical protein